MKSFNVKSLVCGLLLGALGTIGISTVYASGDIKLAKYENIKVSFNNSSVPLRNSLVSVVKNGENDANIYMPVTEILEYLGYNAKWNPSEHSINISTNNEKKSANSTCDEKKIANSLQNPDNKNIAKNQGDKLALEFMQKTGNWSYVEPLFPYMTPEGVKDVVDLYINQKGGNRQKIESAIPYMNKDNFKPSNSNELKTQADYDTLASNALSKTNDMFSILAYLPYMSTDKIDTLVKDYIGKTNNFNCIYNIHKYMSTKAIDDTVKSYIDKTGDYGIVASMLGFMSSDASNYVAKKYISESKNQQYYHLFKPYLKN